MVKKDNSWVSPQHLLITVYAGILFLACACVNTGMTNTILPRICELRGWEYADALPFMSYGGYIGAAATLLFAQLVVKRGAKFVIVLGLALGGLCLALYGLTTVYAVFVLCIIGNRIFSCAYQQAGCTALLNNWFPRKKGVVLGWATMGIILSDVIWSPYIPKAIAAIGAPLTMAIVGAVFLLLALFAAFAVKNIPEETGCYPDNDPTGLDDLAASQTAMRAYRTSFTWGRLLRTPQVWQIGITWGLLWMIAVAFVSLLVQRCVSIGYEPTVFGRWDFAAANRVISPIIMAVSSSAFLLASLFLKSSWGYNGMYAACAVIAVLCLISVLLTKDRMIGATRP